jgi:hypothetical protein
MFSANDGLASTTRSVLGTASDPEQLRRHSHSMVPGGFDVTS